MLTDYSSVAFDFAYLRKPIVYAHFDKEAFFSGEHSYTAGYFDYERDGFGESDCVLGFLDAFRDGAKFDVILCNMIRSELWPLRDDIEDLLAKGGELVISGQLETEKDYVLRWFEEIGLTVVQERVSGEWWSVLARS